MANYPHSWYAHNRTPVKSPKEIEDIRDKVRAAAKEAHANISKLSKVTDGVKDGPMDFLYRLKLERHASDPLEPQRRVKGQMKHRRMSLNDQLFRSFNIMATLAATEKLMKWFPGLEFDLVLGVGRGQMPEIVSLEEDSHGHIVMVEVFSAVSTVNNSVLKKCCERLANSRARHRYVFFHAPQEEAGHKMDLEKRLREQFTHFEPNPYARVSPRMREEDLPGRGVQIWALSKKDIL